MTTENIENVEEIKEVVKDDMIVISKDDLTKYILDDDIKVETTISTRASKDFDPVKQNITFDLSGESVERLIKFATAAQGMRVKYQARVRSKKDPTQWMKENLSFVVKTVDYFKEVIEKGASEKKKEQHTDDTMQRVANMTSTELHAFLYNKSEKLKTLYTSFWNAVQEG